MIPPRPQPDENHPSWWRYVSPPVRSSFCFSTAEEAEVVGFSDPSVTKLTIEGDGFKWFDQTLEPGTNEVVAAWLYGHHSYDITREEWNAQNESSQTLGEAAENS